MSNIGKPVSDGYKWGTIVDECGTMIKVRWDTNGEVSEWRGYENFEHPEGFHMEANLA